MVVMMDVALLGGCATQRQIPSPESFKNPEGPDFVRDRAACLQEAAFTVSGVGKITYGGGDIGNPFVSSGQYMDCMVARGYKAEAIGDVLGTPGTQRPMGN